MKNWTGHTQYLIEVLSLTSRSQGASPIYKCKCKCGNYCEKSARELYQGAQSCGNCNCLHWDEYGILAGIKTRCYNKKNKNYINYGGRGITVCERWRQRGKYGVLLFVEDMGRRPGKEYSVDRIDNDGNYTKENCKWSTAQEQAFNRRNNSDIPHYTGLTESDILTIYFSSESYTDLQLKYSIALRTVQNIKSLNYSPLATSTIGNYFKISNPPDIKAIKFATLKFKLGQT